MLLVGVCLCCCECGGLVLCLRCGMVFAWHVCLFGLLGFLVFWYAGFSVCWGFGCVYWLVVLGGCFLVGFGVGMVVDCCFCCFDSGCC